MKESVHALTTVLLFIILPALGALIGIAITWHQFQFDSTAVGFLTIFYYLFQIIILILTAIPNVILGAIGGAALAGLITLTIIVVQKIQNKKALHEKAEGFDKQ